MGRPLTGKKHVGIRRDTRPNGDVYGSSSKTPVPKPN